MKPPRSPSQGTPPGRVREPVQVYLDPPDRERLERLTPDLGMSQSEVLRKGLVVTHPRVFDPPAPLDAALAFAEAVGNMPNAVSVSPGPRHWEIFTRISRQPDSRGNHLPDAWLAALAIEQGCEFITADRGFARFAGLRWSRPVA